MRRGNEDLSPFSHNAWILGRREVNLSLTMAKPCATLFPLLCIHKKKGIAGEALVIPQNIVPRSFSRPFALLTRAGEVTPKEFGHGYGQDLRLCNSSPVIPSGLVWAPGHQRIPLLVDQRLFFHLHLVLRRHGRNADCGQPRGRRAVRRDLPDGAPLPHGALAGADRKGDCRDRGSTRLGALYARSMKRCLSRWNCGLQKTVGAPCLSVLQPIL